MHIPWEWIIQKPQVDSWRVWQIQQGPAEVSRGMLGLAAYDHSLQLSSYHAPLHNYAQTLSITSSLPTPCVYLASICLPLFSQIRHRSAASRSALIIGWGPESTNQRRWHIWEQAVKTCHDFRWVCNEVVLIKTLWWNTAEVGGLSMLTCTTAADHEDKHSRF